MDVVPEPSTREGSRLECRSPGYRGIGDGFARMTALDDVAFASVITKKSQDKAT